MAHNKAMSFELLYLSANNAAIEMWREYIPDINSEEIFMDECLKYNRAWMFFKHENLILPRNRPFLDGAVVVSSLGEVRHTVSYYPDYNARMKYLATMSDYFEKKGL